MRHGLSVASGTLGSLEEIHHDPQRERFVGCEGAGRADRGVQAVGPVEVVASPCAQSCGVGDVAVDDAQTSRYGPLAQLVASELGD